MSNKYDTKKIISYIVLFPPIALLIYAIVSYIVFFNYQDNINKKILEVERKAFANLAEDTLVSKVESLNRVFKDSNNKELIKFLKKIVINDNKHIVILDKNGNIIYKTADIKNLDFLKKIKGTGFYKDKDIFAYSTNKNKHRFTIVAFMPQKDFSKTINGLEQNILETTKTTVFKSIIWLFIIWFILVSVSLYSSIMVYKKMKEYERALSESNENIIFQSRQAMLGELLPMIAHQWRQPINKIASVLMRMRFEIAKGNPNVSVLDRQCQVIEDSVELMSNTIDDFRSFYRPKQEPEYEDLSLVIRKAIYFLDELLDKKKIKIDTNLAPVKAKIHTNEFLQVIINLIKNAADAVNMYGEIYISLKETDEYIELKIEDNGTGIPQEQIDKIFEPHVSTKQNSMGLGLYMSRLIIENRFGGIIKAYNTANGAGFLIRLPKHKGN